MLVELTLGVWGMSRASFDKQHSFKLGKTKLPKSSHCMARLPENI